MMRQSIQTYGAEQTAPLMGSQGTGGRWRKGRAEGREERGRGGEKTMEERGGKIDEESQIQKKEWRRGETARRESEEG